MRYVFLIDQNNQSYFQKNQPAKIIGGSKEIQKVERHGIGLL